jgi:hypothetical protein
MVNVTWKIPSQVLVDLSFRIEVQRPKLAFVHVNLPVKRRGLNFIVAPRLSPYAHM